MHTAGTAAIQQQVGDRRGPLAHKTAAIDTAAPHRHADVIAVDCAPCGLEKPLGRWTGGPHWSGAIVVAAQTPADEAVAGASTPDRL